MLEFIDASLEAFLRATVPLSATDVDVSFEPPDREWSAKLNRPTVNLFLWDIKRSSDRARAGMETYEVNGKLMRRMALPRVELRYLITAWTSEHRDERAVLGGMLRAVLAHHEIPATFRAAELATLSPPTLLLARSGEIQIDVFKTLEGQLKPALDVIVTTDVDTGLGMEAAAPVVEVGVGLSDRTTNGRRSAQRRIAGEVPEPAAIGARVVTPRGATTVNAAGRFLVAAAPGDQIVVETEPPLTAIVPEVGGVVIG